jgi:hypothetical protein
MIISGKPRTESSRVKSRVIERKSYPILSAETCIDSYPNGTLYPRPISDAICVSTGENSNFASGQGLMVLENGKWTIRGVSSLPLASDESEDYLLFTDVAKNMEWIEENI